MNVKRNIQLAFFGDDFTGSTDALEFLTRAGLRTILFLDNLGADQLAKFGELDAVGIAGMTRALPPMEMEATLEHDFKALNNLNPRHVHYKVCSTFDSSPEIGNIGTAIETGIKVFNNAFTPILVAAPHLGRYSAFGNLFARMGIGSAGEIFRLDRHPSMRSHPVTPSRESDLLLHLGSQTALPMGLIDLNDLQDSVAAIQQKIDREVAIGKRILFFDVMYDEQMAKIGEVIDQRVPKGKPLFSVGSSGVEKALGDFWSKKKLFRKREDWQELDESTPLLVISGSVSPVTKEQIECAVDNGFIEIRVDPKSIVEVDQTSYTDQYKHLILDAFRKGKSVILHTAKGPDDNRVMELQSLFESKGWDEATRRQETSKRFGKILGQTALKALAEFPVKRMVIAGGDTSGYVARELGIDAVEMITPVYPGAPICKAYASDSPVDGMDVNIKGGQVGDKDYFIKIRTSQ